MCLLNQEHAARAPEQLPLTCYFLLGATLYLLFIPVFPHLPIRAWSTPRFFFPENKVLCYLICQEAKHESQELLCLLLRAAGLSLAGKWCTGGRGRARRQQVALLFVPHPWSLQDPSSESSGPSPAELVEPNAECPHLILAKTQTPH